MTSSDADDFRPQSNSNRTKDQVDDIEGAGCSNTISTPNAASFASDTTSNILQEMTYVGGMNYAKTRLLDATGPKPAGKGRKVTPATLQSQIATNALTSFKATPGRLLHIEQYMKRLWPAKLC